MTLYIKDRLEVPKLVYHLLLSILIGTLCIGAKTFTVLYKIID